MRLPDSVSVLPFSRVTSLTVPRGGSLNLFLRLNRDSTVEIRRRFDKTFVDLRCFGVVLSPGDDR